MIYGPGSLFNHVCGDHQFHFVLEKPQCTPNPDTNIIAGLILFLLPQITIFFFL